MCISTVVVERSSEKDVVGLRGDYLVPGSIEVQQILTSLSDTSFHFWWGFWFYWMYGLFYVSLCWNSHLWLVPQLMKPLLMLLTCRVHLATAARNYWSDCLSPAVLFHCWSEDSTGFLLYKLLFFFLFRNSIVFAFKKP